MTNTNHTVTLNAISDVLNAAGDYRVLRRLPPVVEHPGVAPSPAEADTWKHGVVLDTETTGLDTNTAKIIELGLKPFSYDALGVVRWAGDAVSFFEDPGEPLSDEVKKVTGLTDDDLKGKHIDDARVQDVINGADIVISHNAKFDRPIAERRFTFLADKHWACSMELIDWRALGCPSVALPCIAWALGYFYHAHRADADCDALLSILAVASVNWHSDPLGQCAAFSTLLENARRPTYRVWAVNSPFEAKDALKARGYKWHDGLKGRVKSWYRDMPSEADAAAEQEWLREQKFSAQPDVTAFTAKHRYTERTFA